MPAWLGWFITFNFVNLSFVVFRAREWRDAVKVLSGMADAHGFMSIALRENFGLLSIFQSRFGKTLLAGIGGRNETWWGIISIMILVFVFKNSNELSGDFKASWKSLAFLFVISFYTLLNMSKVSEFLYFQF
jgi:hypothetical protein